MKNYSFEVTFSQSFTAQSSKLEGLSGFSLERGKRDSRAFASSFGKRISNCQFKRNRLYPLESLRDGRWPKRLCLYPLAGPPASVSEPRQQSGIVFWVLSDCLGIHHPLRTVGWLGFHYLRTKERKPFAYMHDSAGQFRRNLCRSVTKFARYFSVYDILFIHFQPFKPRQAHKLNIRAVTLFLWTSWSSARFLKVPSESYFWRPCLRETLWLFGSKLRRGSSETSLLNLCYWNDAATMNWNWKMFSIRVLFRCKRSFQRILSQLGTTQNSHELKPRNYRLTQQK